ATFPANVIEQWRADVKRSVNLSVEYQAIGSGGGRSQFIAGTVDFGASDVPLTAAETQQANEKHGSFFTIPITAGGIAIEYRLDGAQSVRLTPATLARIFSGSIKKWNDAAITADNGVALPDKDIVVYVRSDRSGTSEVFTDYLSKAAPAQWTTGANGNFPTTGRQIGRSGSDGVSNAVRGQDGSIGYSELSFAVERNIGVARIRNSAGQFKSPADAGAVSEAIDDATFNADGTLTLNYLTTNPSAYPISTTSYVLAPAKLDAAKGDNLKAFLDYALGDGQAKAAPLSYAALPARLVTSGRQKVASINAAVAQAPSSTTAPSSSTTTPGSSSSTTTAVPSTTATTVAPATTASGSGSAVAASGTTSSGSSRSTAAAPATTTAPMARTGADSIRLTMVGLAMVLAGWVLSHLSRRRTG
ncbi:MAG: phosphate ABC transporter substrate-binding protein PstS, partial [Acidimicrobiales bacterium]